mmetsp:Transcript_41257/g.110263  ORF Transcript_41257/g.110263 Transcript_41257/m.110263 type:complete len:144 (+) Transcript_41257:107-538(+)
MSTLDALSMFDTLTVEPLDMSDLLVEENRAFVGFHKFVGKETKHRTSKSVPCAADDCDLPSTCKDVDLPFPPSPKGLKDDGSAAPNSHPENFESLRAFSLSSGKRRSQRVTRSNSDAEFAVVLPPRSLHNFSVGRWLDMESKA